MSQLCLEYLVMTIRHVYKYVIQHNLAYRRHLTRSNTQSAT